MLTFTDTPPGTGTYYYVVSAVTPSGETAASSEATAVTGVQLDTYLPFDEGGGIAAADSSGHARAATLVAGASWAAGKIGSAVSLDGATGYVALPPDLLADVSDFTVTAWVYWNVGGAAEQRVFDFGTGVDQYMMLTAKYGDGRLRFATTLDGASGEEAIEDTAPLAAAQWVHVAVTLSGTVGTLYVNGSAVGSNTAMQFAPFRLGHTGQNWIGRSQYAADPYFNGLVDELRIYRGALSPAQVAALSGG